MSALLGKFIPPAIEYVNTNWAGAANNSYFEREILSRSAYLILTPASMILSALDTLIGLGAGVLAILTCGQVPYLNGLAVVHSPNASFLLCLPYINLLSAVNPQLPVWDLEARAFQDYWGSFLITPLRGQAEAWSASEHLIEQHLFSRLAYFLLAVAALITRLALASIALPLAALSLLTLGSIPEVTATTVVCLQLPGIISDVLFSTLYFINPWVERSIRN